MEHEVACSSGKAITVSEGTAGSSAPCECGTTVLIPPPDESAEKSVTDATRPPVSVVRPNDRPTPEPKPLPEIIAPTPVSLRAGRGSQPGPRSAVMAALTPGILWIQDAWRLRSL